MSKIKVNNSNIKEIEESSNISLLKFSAEWCGPCQMFQPVYSEASTKNEDILFGEVDIDEDDVKPIVSKYGVNTVPTTIVFKGGKEVERFSGYLSIEKLQEHIDKNK